MTIREIAEVLNIPEGTDKELSKKFKEAKEVTIPIDVQRGVMEEILDSKDHKRPFFLVPALLGIALLLIALSLAEAPGVEPFSEEPDLVVIEYPRNFSPYPSPYGSVEVLKIQRGRDLL